MASSVVSRASLPPNWPIDYLSSEFCESLGRAVATFGYLEKVLGKAILVFVSTREFGTADELESQLESLYEKLDIALTGSLGALIDQYESAVKSHQENPVLNFEELLKDLREAARLRNVICHGLWRHPDSEGASLPYFVTQKKKEKVTSPMNRDDLDKTQQQVAGLICAIIDSVTSMGWKFPGLHSPGRRLVDLA